MTFPPPTAPVAAVRPLRSLATGLPLAAAALALGAGLAGWLEWQPDATNRLRDDAFYEFAWAANLAAGNGPTVSDGVTTSGVQLLWSLGLVPVAWLCGAAALPAIAPWLGLLLHAATAGLWWHQARDRLAGACLAACWLGHPLLLRESQNGQETALACLLASCLWFARGASGRAFGALAVLAVLARSDLLGVVVGLALVRLRDHGASALVAPALAAGVHTAANLVLGGSAFPDSALPMAWLWHANHQLADPDGSAWWPQVWWYLRPVLLGNPFALASALGLGACVFLVVRPRWPAKLRALPAVLVGAALWLGARDLLAAAWAAALLALLPARGPRRVPRALLALLVGLSAIVVLHWAVRWYPRDYYLAPLAVAGFAAVARLARLRWLLAAFALAQLADGARVAEEPLAAQAEMALAGRFLAEVLPPGERVGCFNSGLVTFHAAVLAGGAARRGVVNLDGVVDARAFAALRRAGLWAWLDGERVRFVLDNPVQFASDPRLPHACGPWIAPGFDAARDLVEVARFDVPGRDNGRPGGDSMRLYWRRGRGEAPRPATAARDLGVGPTGERCVLWPAQPGETLVLEAADGTARTLLTCDAATSVVVALPLPPHAGGRLYVEGRQAPVLVIAPL